MWTVESEVPYPVQNIWMFANWYAELNSFSFATFPPVSDHDQDWFSSISTVVIRFMRTCISRQK